MATVGDSGFLWRLSARRDNQSVSQCDAPIAMLTEFERLVSPLKWVLFLAPLGLVFFACCTRLHKMTWRLASPYSGFHHCRRSNDLLDLLVYAHGSIARVFSSPRRRSSSATQPQGCRRYDDVPVHGADRRTVITSGGEHLHRFDRAAIRHLGDVLVFAGLTTSILRRSRAVSGDGRLVASKGDHGHADYLLNLLVAYLVRFGLAHDVFLLYSRGAPFFYSGRFRVS